jgi:hypothetical protein
MYSIILKLTVSISRMDIVFDQCMSRDKLRTNSSKSVVKVCQTKFYHKWYSEDYFMNETKHFRQIFYYLFRWHIKPVTMIKMLPFNNSLASRFHWTIRQNFDLINSQVPTSNVRVQPIRALAFIQSKMFIAIKTSCYSVICQKFIR